MAQTSTTVAEPQKAWAGQGAVLLDIGGDIGALVVAMPTTMVGNEVEIRPRDGHDHEQQGHHHVPDHLAHVAVVARPVGDGHQPSLVFAELDAGRYDLFEKGRGDAVTLEVEVTGGEVVTAAWPGAALT